jgi:hypothetical protein
VEFPSSGKIVFAVQRQYPSENQKDMELEGQDDGSNWFQSNEKTISVEVGKIIKK